LDHPDSALAEAMRSLRAAIGFAQDKASKTVLITSPTVDEGKTFTAIGLARAAAQSGDRVLIIDCDARRRGLSRAFGVKSEAGLIEALQQRFTVSQVLLKDNRTNLHILPLAAFERQDRPELLESPEFRTFTAALAPHYDLIVLDAGPVLLSSAVQVISSWADAVVLSLKWRGTTKGQTEAALDLLARARANLVGCVLTQADVTNPRFFEDGDMGAMLSRYADYFKA
jgi:capsular exopolysaccharide synthesis family protein